MRVVMGKSKNMAKIGHMVTRSWRLVLKPRGPVCSKRVVSTFDSLTKIHKHAQVIFHNGIARDHTSVSDTGPQKFMIGWDGSEIIKRHYTWIDVHGVNI